MKLANDYIDDLAQSITVETIRVPDTNVVIAAAFLGKAVLAVEWSACMDAVDFDLDIGRSIAGEKAFAAAQGKLWELEGWAQLRERSPLKEIVN